jgi:hypothetical protein
MVVYFNLNYWVFGILSTAGYSKKHSVSKNGYVFVLTGKEGGSALLGPFEGGNFNHWTSPMNVVWFSGIPDDGQIPKTQ